MIIELKKIRKNKKLSANKVCEDIGLEKSVLLAWETKKRSPRVKGLNKLLRYYKKETIEVL